MLIAMLLKENRIFFHFELQNINTFWQSVKLLEKSAIFPIAMARFLLARNFYVSNRLFR